MGIPENLKRLRAEKEMSQSALANKAKVAQQLISQLERGKNLTTRKLPEIARALGVAVEDIDPNYATDDALRAKYLAIFDALDPDLRPVALSRIEALVPAKSSPQSTNLAPKASRARR